MTFRGKVTIRGSKTGRPSKRITMHQKNLKISNVKIKKTSDTSSSIEVNRINNHDNLNEVRLHTTETIHRGEYEISLEFKGKINDQMHGLYPSYFKHNGKKKYLLATQFESHHAREVFPCIDEPEAKATFDLTLHTKNELVVLANTPAKKIQNGKETITTFETTPIMSTYLLAFVVGELHGTNAKTKNGHTVKTWTTIAQPIESTRYANSEAVAVLDFFEEYFKTPYPLKKLDQVALPDFESGAMENWGLITYREIALLADQKNRSISSEQYISMVIAHEISHQWFGNLVTMKWWDDLWPNESFASLMEHIALDALHSEWHQWEQYVSMDVLAASNRDVYSNVQAVGVKVKHPDEIYSLFDSAIVYAKGGRLLKMLLDYIGEKPFRDGLKNYFTKYGYKNTTRDDLWTELSTSSHKEIQKIMNPWLEKSGMPLLSVDIKNGNKIELHQERFLLDSKAAPGLWPIPLLPTPSQSVDLLKEKSITFSTKEPNKIIFNSSGSSHFVTNYKNTSSKDFIKSAISNQTIQPPARINILNDLLLLSKRGDISLVEPLQIINECGAEPRSAVWELICRVINLAQMLTENDLECETAIQQLRVCLAKMQFSKLGWENHKNDDPNTINLRNTLLSLMARGKDKNVVKEAINRFNKVDDVSDLPADIRGIVVSTAVKNSDVDIDKLIANYQQVIDGDVLTAITLGLCSVQDQKTAKYIIKNALGNKGFVRPQDIFRWYAYLMQNKFTRELAWDWLTNEWERLEKVFGPSKSFDHFILYSAKPLSTKQWFDEFNKFFSPKTNNIALKRNIEIALVEIDSRVRWRDRDEPKVRQYLLQT